MASKPNKGKKRTRASSRLGAGGEFESASSPASADDVREQVFVIARQLVPKMFKDLAEGPFRQLHRLRKQDPNDDQLVAEKRLSADRARLISLIEQAEGDSITDEQLQKAAEKWGMSRERARAALDALRELDADPFENLEASPVRPRPFVPDGYHAWAKLCLYATTSKPEFAPLMDELRAWAERRNIVGTTDWEDWVLNRALHLLHNWYEKPDEFEKRTVYYHGFLDGSWLTPEPPRIRIREVVDVEADIAGWDVIRELGTVFRKRFRKPFIERAKQVADRLADEIIEKVRESVSKDTRLQETPEKRELERHTVWLVRFQFDGQPYRRIAQYETPKMVTPQAVMNAVKELADLIGISLRESPRGRPTGTRTRSRN